MILLRLSLRHYSVAHQNLCKIIKKSAIIRFANLFSAQPPRLPDRLPRQGMCRVRIMAGNVIWRGVRHVILRVILSRRDLGGYGDMHIFVNGYSMFGACAAYAAACVRMSKLKNGIAYGIIGQGQHTQHVARLSLRRDRGLHLVVPRHRLTRGVAFGGARHSAAGIGTALHARRG